MRRKQETMRQSYLIKIKDGVVEIKTLKREGRAYQVSVIDTRKMCILRHHNDLNLGP